MLADLACSEEWSEVGVEEVLLYPGAGGGAGPQLYGIRRHLQVDHP